MVQINSNTYVDASKILEMEALFDGAIMLGPILHSYNFEQNLKRWKKAKDEMRKFYD